MINDMNVIHVVSMSGGKDSLATGLLAIQNHPKESLRFIFADTGNEHEDVYKYLTYLESALDIAIDRIKVDFDKQINNKRMFIARDNRVKRVYRTIDIKDQYGNVVCKKKVGGGKKMRWTNKAKRRALKVLHPTGNSYLDLCLWKGRFPSRRAQFCTQFLKTEPLVKYQLELIDQGYEVISWQGVRRDESLARANVLQIEYAADGLWQYRPIADWSADDVFNFAKEKNIEPNQLYKKGMSRVGCMPCINAGKNEIKEIAARFPEHIKRISEWEILCAQASKRFGASFFPDTIKSGMNVPDVYAKIEWAKTSRGGRQYDLFADDEPSACSSAYGLCE